MKKFTKQLVILFDSEPKAGLFQCTDEIRLYKRYLENQEKLKKRVENFNKFSN